MIDAIGIQNEYDYDKYKNLSFTSCPTQEKSIFLEEKLEAIEDKQGVLGQTWNGIKELTTLGISQSDCEKMLEKYNNGEISFEEAIGYLDEYDSKQKNMSNLLSNILTGVGGIAVATAAIGTGPIGWAFAFAKGAPIGAALKAGIGVIDRATNDVKNDEFDLKNISKDAISGALTGAASAVSSASSVGYQALINNGALKTGTLAADIAKGALCGVECGAMSGAAGYMTDVAFGDKEFDFGDLTSTTLTSAFVSGTVGGVIGASGHALDANHLAQVVSEKGRIIKDSIFSSSRKIGGQIEREALNL